MASRRKILYIYLKLLQTVKNFLLNGKNREFLIFLFFFFMAGCFWLLQTLNKDYEAEFSIPVRLKDVPNNIVITSEPSPELRVKLKDRGTVLLNYFLGRDFFPINLSFLDYKHENNHVKIYSYEFEKKILSQLSVSTKIISVKPDTLDYIYSTGKSKKVPVVFRGKLVQGVNIIFLILYIDPTRCWYMLLQEFAIRSLLHKQRSCIWKMLLKLLPSI